MVDDCCSPKNSPDLASAERNLLVRKAFRLEWITIGWMSVEAIVAVAAGVIAHSLLLIAFGIDSVIELASACVLIWRLAVELRNGQAFSEDAERHAGRVGGALLFALAAYVILTAGWSLWVRHGAEFSIPGLALTLAAIPIMYVLAKQKLSFAERLNSRALRADAVESITCRWLSFVVVIGLVAQAVLQAWWVDGVVSLGILYFLVKEGLEAWRGEECCEAE